MVGYRISNDSHGLSCLEHRIQSPQTPHISDSPLQKPQNMIVFVSSKKQITYSFMCLCFPSSVPSNLKQEEKYKNSKFHIPGPPPLNWILTEHNHNPPVGLKHGRRCTDKIVKLYQESFFLFFNG